MSHTYKKGDRVVLTKDLPQFNLYTGDSGTILEVYRGGCYVHFNKWLHGVSPHRYARNRECRYDKPAHTISNDYLKLACMFGQ